MDLPSRDRFEGAITVEQKKIMADVLDPKKESKFWEQALSWLTTGASWDTWEGVFKFTLILIIVIALLAWAVGYLFDKLAKALEAYKNSGLPVTFDRKKRVQVRRRAQFCNVLKSDLSTLAKAENWNDQWFTELEAEVEAE